MLIEPTAAGLYCAAGGFHIDPWHPVDRAVITHAHGDHLRQGSSAYLCSAPALPIVRQRLWAFALSGALGAFNHSYWTLAYLRLTEQPEDTGPAQASAVA